MKRTLGLALAALLTAGVAYAQNPAAQEFQLTLTPAQQFVVTSKTAPEFWNKEKGWVEVKNAQHAGAVSLLVFGESGRMELTLTLGIAIDVYQNDEAGLHTEVLSWQSKDGTKEEFGMIYGDSVPTVTRYAIKVGNLWFVAKEISSPDKNDFLVHDAILVQDPIGSLRPLSVMVRLDTVDGMKDRLLILK